MPKAARLNDDVQEQLDGIYQRRYDNAFAWSRVVSVFQTIPGLRGFWPMSSRDQNNDVYDLSGQGRTLTRSNVNFSVSGLIPYSAYSSALSSYLHRADEAGLDIIGNEAGETVHPGLTVGGWFFPTVTLNLAGYIAKYTNVAATSAFALHQSTSVSNGVRFVVYSGGAAYPVLSAADAGSLDTWHFLVGRFVPSTSVSVFTNGTFANNTTGIPATLTNSTGDLEIGRLAGALAYYTGSASLCFLCGSALPDTWINTLYHLSRPLFGIR